MANKLPSLSNVHGKSFKSVAGIGKFVKAINCVYTIGSETSNDYITNGANDTTVFQQALDDINSNGGGKLIVMNGTYNITANLNIRSNTIVEGFGKSANFILTPSISILIDNRKSVVVRNIKIDHSNSNLNRYAIYIGNSNDVTIDNVEITCKSFGIFIASGNPATPCFNITVINNKLKGLGNSDVIGGGPIVAGCPVRDIFISNNYITQDITNPIGVPYSNVFNIVGVENVIFTNNHCYGRVTFGFENGTNRLSHIINNRVQPAIGDTQTWIETLQGSSGIDFGLIISGNILTLGSINILGDSVNKTKEITVSNNYIGTYGVTGIVLRHVENSNVTGNTIKSPTSGDAILLNNSQYISITNNNIINGLRGVYDVTPTQSPNIFITANTTRNVTNQYVVSGSANVNNNQNW